MYIEEGSGFTHSSVFRLERKSPGATQNIRYDPSSLLLGGVSWAFRQILGRTR